QYSYQFFLVDVSARDQRDVYGWPGIVHHFFCGKREIVSELDGQMVIGRRQVHATLADGLFIVRLGNLNNTLERQRFDKTMTDMLETVQTHDNGQRKILGQVGQYLDHPLEAAGRTPNNNGLIAVI